MCVIKSHSFVKKKLPTWKICYKKSQPSEKSPKSWKYLLENVTT